MFEGREERREARRLGLNVAQYRMKKRAEEEGRSYEDVHLEEALSGLRQMSGLDDIGLYSWFKSSDVPLMRGLKAQVQHLITEAAERHGVSERDILERWGPEGLRTVPLVRLSSASVYESPPRLEVPDEGGIVMRYEITAETEATVEASGGIAATRGRNLAEKGWATAFTVSAGLGPLGAFLYGNAKETIHDGRELYLLLTDTSWHYTLAVHPDFGPAVRDFAQAINGLARRNRGEGSLVSASETTDKIGKLKQLAELRSSGALSDEEFNSLKADVLAD